MADSTTRQPMSSMPSVPLSDLQLELLKLYSTELTSQDLIDIKRLLGSYFGRRAIQAADRVWDESSLVDGDMDAWLHG